MSVKKGDSLSVSVIKKGRCKIWLGTNGTKRERRRKKKERWNQIDGMEEWNQNLLTICGFV